MQIQQTPKKIFLKFNNIASLGFALSCLSESKKKIIKIINLRIKVFISFHIRKSQPFWAIRPSEDSSILNRFRVRQVVVVGVQVQVPVEVEPGKAGQM